MQLNANLDQLMTPAANLQESASRRAGGFQSWKRRSRVFRN